MGHGPPTQEQQAGLKEEQRGPRRSSAVLELDGLQRVWLHLCIIPALRRQRQEDPKLKASLSYTVRPYLKNKTKNCLQLSLVDICLPSRL
jgi:hypothetical protein